MEASLYRHNWWIHWSLVTDSISSSSFLPRNQGVRSNFPTLFSRLIPQATAPILSKSRLRDINLGVVERGLLGTTHSCHIYGSEVLLGTEDKRLNMTEEGPTALTAQEISWIWGAVIHNYRWSPIICERYILIIWMTKHIFLIIHNITQSSDVAIGATALGHLKPPHPWHHAIPGFSMLKFLMCQSSPTGLTPCITPLGSWILGRILHLPKLRSKHMPGT